MEARPRFADLPAERPEKKFKDKNPLFSPSEARLEATAVAQKNSRSGCRGDVASTAVPKVGLRCGRALISRIGAS